MKLLPIVVIALSAATFAQAQDSTQQRAYPIAGLNPSQRPAGAPVIKDAGHDKTWESRFLYGVSRPIPPNLGAPADWGNWYVPFDHAGLTGRYDIRGWHAQKASQTPTGRNISARKKP